eukprot:3143093-Ditylum_brightwellii.AAC.1
MSKRVSEVPHEPNPCPSSRVQLGTDAGIIGSTVPPGDPISVIPSSNAAESNVGPATDAGES